jgi:hypothetical protein
MLKPQFNHKADKSFLCGKLNPIARKYSVCFLSCINVTSCLKAKTNRNEKYDSNKGKKKEEKHPAFTNRIW